jgi:hypothetical protein
MRWWWQDLKAGPCDQCATPAAYGRAQAHDQGAASWSHVQHVHATLRCAMRVRGLLHPLGPPVRVAQLKGDGAPGTRRTPQLQQHDAARLDARGHRAHRDRRRLRRQG